MPRVNFTRSDRIAQMSKQEQLIAQKRQQILEKQRTLQMAKQIAAEATKSNTLETNETEPDKPGGTIKLPFSNDGSFLENFKKLSEKFVKPPEETPVQVKRPAEDEAEEGASELSSEKKLKPDDVVLVPVALPPPPPPTPPSIPQIPNMPMEIPFAAYYNIAQPAPMMAAMTSASLIVPSIPPHMVMVEAPKPIETAINVPPPMPEQVAVVQNSEVFSEQIKLPTTVEELVELVADIGDVYEEKLSTRKNELHPSLWFLFDKQSEAYRNYRHMIVARLFRSAGIEHVLPPPPQLLDTSTPPGPVSGPADDSKYDPEDVLDDTNMDEELPDQAQHSLEPPQMQPNYYGDENHFYDDKSTTETDSDTEYVRAARKRILKNLKTKTMNAGNVQDKSSSDSEDDFGENSDSKQDNGSDRSGSNMGAKSGRQQRQKKKTRWGDNAESSEVQGIVDSKGSAEGSQNSGSENSDHKFLNFGQQHLHPNSRSNPGFLQFVFQNYGTIEVSPESWKKAEEHFRIRLLYEDMSTKIQAHERFTSDQIMGGVRGNCPEKNNDEDQRLNSEKMNSVVSWMNEITKFYDRCRPSSLEEFLMRDEYDAFLEKFRKDNEHLPNFEDYKKFKLQQAKIVSTNSRGEYSSSESDFKNARNNVKSNSQPPNDSVPVSTENDKGARKRKSRWGEKIPETTVNECSAPKPSTSNETPRSGPSKQSTNAPKLSSVNRTDPALLAYVRQNFGSTNLSEEDWKKAEDHFKINLLYQDMLRKRQEVERLAASGKFKYEYDSDEDVDGGTWEHKLRSQEMEATQLWATELTKNSEGKHHIGDFLPPEELRKFMEKYDAQKNNREPNLSDYKEYKLREDNVGFQMLQKLGWKEGQGLGADGTGIVDPINKASQRDNNQGLGVASADNPEVDDNEYDAYRKRMMLAYRFRPNPLNNPRRAYY
ncbi:uncharacterized protein LOC129760429 [Uranotaenia lowii]|uniref:uncharacterized protein LOC129760429 n=1 Tax=Uranotaenia lowii TaxID=190385 RepID=UPI002479EB3B|nr:uncharacterized protein LOC129760429 [Uranotaenia lowii]